ncbi:MAG: phage shock protein PspA [Saccharospirillaceae bacterium]|nr:phage shock protein PspA [Pseudomonadales bacterium]NRB78043.1 phage shock protein PspA [Saccharospirillaceae bacterium]
MGIFSRLTDIVNSNLTALLDKAEDPKKMIRLIIQEMEETLIEVRSSSAKVIADKKTLARHLSRLKDEAVSWGEKAKLAISKNREDLARGALGEKQALLSEVEINEDELVELENHLDHLTDEVEQLQLKINDAKAKQKTLQMRHETVSNRVKVKRQSHKKAVNNAFDKLDRFERRIDQLEGELESYDIAADQDLVSQFEDLAKDDKINDELEALKQQLKSEKS